MKDWYIKVSLVVIACLLVYIGITNYINHKKSFNSLDYKPKGNEVAAVTVVNRDVVITNTKGDSKTVTLPRKGDLQVGVGPSGEIRVNKASVLQPSWHLGLMLCSKGVQPSLGIQFLRLGRLGLSVNVDPEMLSLSAERDLDDIYTSFQNSFVGLFIRPSTVEYGGNTIGVILGVYF